jgi:hypothetical protein
MIILNANRGFALLHEGKHDAAEMAFPVAWKGMTVVLAVTNRTVDHKPEFSWSEFALRGEGADRHVNVVSGCARVFDAADVNAIRDLVQHFVCRVYRIHDESPNWKCSTSASNHEHQQVHDWDGYPYAPVAIASVRTMSTVVSSWFDMPPRRKRATDWQISLQICQSNTETQLCNLFLSKFRAVEQHNRLRAANQVEEGRPPTLARRRILRHKPAGWGLVQWSSRI